MQDNAPQYTTGQRLTATAIGLVVVLGMALIAASVAIDFGVQSEFATKMASQSAIPFVFIFWKWPGLVLNPISALKRLIHK